MKRIPTSDAAAILGIRVESVRRYIDDETLHAIKLGTRYLVLKSEVEALAARRSEFKSDYPRLHQRRYKQRYRARQREGMKIDG